EQLVRGRARERAADADAVGARGGGRAARAAGLQGLRVRPAHLRHIREPRPDPRHRRGRWHRVDAVEPSQRLRGRGPRGQEPAGGPMRLALVAVLVLAAALMFAAFVWADQRAANELGRLMILEYHKADYPEDRWTRTPEDRKSVG